MTHVSTAARESEIDMERRVNRVPYPGIERRCLSDRGFQRNAVYGHRLELAPGGNWLRTPVVLSRLEKEFCYIEADEELGRRHAEQLLECLESSLKHGFSVERQRLLHRLARGASGAVHVRFGDNPGSDAECLETVLIPMEPVVFGYQSIEHRIKALPVLVRCANVLGYEVVELRGGK